MKDVGISIEGIGSGTDTGASGRVWGYTGTPPKNTGGFTWSDGLVDVPTPGKDSAEPRTMDLDLAGFSASLHGRPSIIRSLFAHQDTPIYRLGQSIDAVDGTITIHDGSGATVASGVPEVIYVGAETILVKQDLGAGVYAVIRGLYSSKAVQHNEGEGIFTKPPFMRNRLVHFWTHDGEVMRRRGRGFLKDISPTDGMMAIDLQIEGPLSAMGGVTRMRESPALAVLDQKIQARGGLYLSIDISEFSSQTSKPLASDGTPRNEWTDSVSLGPYTSAMSPVWLQSDGHITTLDIFAAQSSGLSIMDSYGSGPTDIEGNTPETTDPGPIDTPVYELAVWNRQLNTLPYTRADALSVFEEPFQPLAIAAALLCSGDSDQVNPQDLDFVNGRLGMGAGWLFGDRGRQSFIDMANEDKDIFIDHLALGWDGEPVEVLDVALRLMHAHGYWLAPDIEGYLIVRRFDPLTVESYGKALNNQIDLLYGITGAPTVRQKPGYARILQRYTASVGKTDTCDGTSVSGSGGGATARLDQMVDPDESEIDLNAWRTDRAQDAVDILVRQAIFLSANMPTLTISANDFELDDLDYSIGEWATISVPEGSDAVLYDTDGELVEASGADLTTYKWAMQIIGRGWNTLTDAYEIDGLLVGHGRRPARYIAPELVVKTGTTQIVGGLLRSLIYYDPDAGVDGSVGDHKEFHTGQSVQLFDEDMSLREPTVLEIEVIGVSAVRFSGAFINVPQPGDIIRLAEFDLYTPVDFGGQRGYCYLANDNDALGSAGEEADEWQ